VQRLVIVVFFALVLSELCAVSAFDIEKFTDPQKYGWKTQQDRNEYRSDLFERQKLLQIYEMEAQSVSGNILKSALFPGWGQFNAKSYTKGQIFLGIEVALLGTSYFYYDKALDYHKKYRNATQIDHINNYYNQAQTPYQYSIVFLSLASIVWAYNVFDVIQTTEDYNATVWKKTLQNYYKAPVKISPNGIEIKF